MLRDVQAFQLPTHFLGAVLPELSAGSQQCISVLCEVRYAHLLMLPAVNLTPQNLDEDAGYFEEALRTNLLILRPEQQNGIADEPRIPGEACGQSAGELRR